MSHRGSTPLQQFDVIGVTSGEEAQRPGAKDQAHLFPVSGSRVIPPAPLGRWNRSQSMKSYERNEHRVRPETVSAAACFVFYSRLFEYSQNTARIEHKDRRRKGDQKQRGFTSTHQNSGGVCSGRKEDEKKIKEQQTGARQVSRHFISPQVLYERGNYGGQEVKKRRRRRRKMVGHSKALRAPGLQLYHGPP